MKRAERYRDIFRNAAVGRLTTVLVRRPFDLDFLNALADQLTEYDLDEPDEPAPDDDLALKIVGGKQTKKRARSRDTCRPRKFIEG